MIFLVWVVIGFVLVPVLVCLLHFMWATRNEPRNINEHITYPKNLLELYRYHRK